MTSLPESYQPTLQTITAAERANLALGKSSKVMKADDLIAFLIEEAQHCVIIEERARVAESALAAHARRRSGRGKPKEVSKSESEDTCKNCERPGHTKFDCWSKGGGKEGQGPKQKKAKGKEKESAAIADDNDEQMFAFTCTSDCSNTARTHATPKSQLQDHVDSATSQYYHPNHSKFQNYHQTTREHITTVDGQHLKAVGVGDMYIRLPNGSEHPKSLLNNAIYASDRVFPLISISKLDKANFSVSFNNGICEIKSPTGFMMATTPCSNGLYMITQPEEHQKPNHIKYSAFKQAEPEGYCTYQPNNKSVNPKCVRATVE